MSGPAPAAPERPPASIAQSGRAASPHEPRAIQVPASLADPEIIRPAPSSTAPSPRSDGSRPLDDAAFARHLAALAPFERPPRLAVAVSGGADSMALCLLTARWARAVGGQVIGLTVDHGLRPESRHEAATVGRWLSARRIAHTVLTWAGPKPARASQAAARAARYRLLDQWCRDQGVLHLLLGHHLEDQAETAALRAARASGPDGLAAMARVREVEGLRHLRPLLDVPRARFLATLDALGQPWLEDPSNSSADFARARLRADPGWDRASAAGSAAAHGVARAARERRLAVWLVAHMRVDPAGCAWLDRQALDAAPDAIAGAVLRQVLAMIGGAPYPPRRARLDHLLDWLRARAPGAGRTLAGCRVLPERDRLLVCREAGAITHVLGLRAGGWQMWDRRFAIRVSGGSAATAGRPGRAGQHLIVRALDDALWSACRHLRRCDSRRPPPAPVRAGLPAILRGGEVLAVPLLDLLAPGLGLPPAIVRFRPVRPAAGPPFAPGSRAGGRNAPRILASWPG